MSDLGLGTVALALGLALEVWPWPIIQGQNLGGLQNSPLTSVNSTARFSFFDRYNHPSTATESDDRRHERQLVFYLDTVNSATFGGDDLDTLWRRSDFAELRLC